MDDESVGWAPGCVVTSSSSNGSPVAPIPSRRAFSSVRFCRSWPPRGRASRAQRTVDTGFQSPQPLAMAWPTRYPEQGQAQDHPPCMEKTQHVHQRFLGSLGEKKGGGPDTASSPPRGARCRPTSGTKAPNGPTSGVVHWAARGFFPSGLAPAGPSPAIHLVLSRRAEPG